MLFLFYDFEIFFGIYFSLGCLIGLISTGDTDSRGMSIEKKIEFLESLTGKVGFLEMLEMFLNHNGLHQDCSVNCLLVLIVVLFMRYGAFAICFG